MSYGHIRTVIPGRIKKAFFIMKTWIFKQKIEKKSFVWPGQHNNSLEKSCNSYQLHVSLVSGCPQKKFSYLKHGAKTNLGPRFWGPCFLKNSKNNWKDQMTQHFGLQVKLDKRMCDYVLANYQDCSEWFGEDCNYHSICPLVHEAQRGQEIHSESHHYLVKNCL